MPAEDPEYLSLKREFLMLFDSSENDFYYDSQITKMLEHDRTRLIVNLNHVRESIPKSAERLLKTPIKAIPPLEDALNDAVDNNESSSNILKDKEKINYRVGINGNFGSHLLVPRDLNASYLTKLVCIEGIVTKISLVRPKRYETVQYCEETKSFTTTSYRDATSFDRDPTSTAIPTKDDQGNPLRIEFGYSKYIDHQKILIQDMPERSEAGQIPRSIEVIVEDDLVDTCKAGDRVRISGVYRAVA